MAEIEENPKTANQVPMADENVEYEYVELEEGQELPEGYEYEYEYVEVPDSEISGEISELDVVGESGEESNSEEVELASASEIEAAISPMNLDETFDTDSVSASATEVIPTENKIGNIPPIGEPEIKDKQVQISQPGTGLSFEDVIGEVKEPHFDNSILDDAIEIGEEVSLSNQQSDLVSAVDGQVDVPALEIRFNNEEIDNGLEEAVSNINDESIFVAPDSIQFQNNEQITEADEVNWFKSNNQGHGVAIGTVEVDQIMNNREQNVSLNVEDYLEPNAVAAPEEISTTEIDAIAEPRFMRPTPVVSSEIEKAKGRQAPKNIFEGLDEIDEQPQVTEKGAESSVLETNEDEATIPLLELEEPSILIEDSTLDNEANAEQINTNETIVATPQEPEKNIASESELSLDYLLGTDKLLELDNLVETEEANQDETLSNIFSEDWGDSEITEAINSEEASLQDIPEAVAIEKIEPFLGQQELLADEKEEPAIVSENEFSVKTESAIDSGQKINSNEISDNSNKGEVDVSNLTIEEVTTRAPHVERPAEEKEIEEAPTEEILAIETESSFVETVETPIVAAVVRPKSEEQPVLEESADEGLDDAPIVIENSSDSETIVNPEVVFPEVKDCSAEQFAERINTARLISKNDGIQSFKAQETMATIALDDIDFAQNELRAWNLILFNQEIVPLTAKVNELSMPRKPEVNRLANLVKGGKQKVNFFNEDSLKIINATEACVAVQGRFVCGDLQTNSGLIINDYVTIALQDFAGKELAFTMPATGLLTGPNGTLLYFFNIRSLLIPNSEIAKVDAEKLQYKISKWYSGTLNDKYFEFDAASQSTNFEGNEQLNAIHVNVNNSSYGWNVTFDNGLSMNLRDLREYQTRFGKMPSPNGVISYGQTKLTFSKVERIVVYESAQYYFYS